MFVSQSRFRRNPKHIFFNDKELLATGNIFRKVCCPFLERDCNPKAVTPHTRLFSTMQSENNFVTSMQCVQVTPAQKELLKLLNHPNAGDFASSLRIIHGLGSYAVDEDMVSPESSYHTHLLLDAINAIATENIIKKLKN